MHQQANALALALIAALSIGPVAHSQTPDAPETPAEQVAPAPAPAPPPPPAAFNSPAATLNTFLESMEEPQDYDRAIECLDLPEGGADKARDDVNKLSGILNRIAEVRTWPHPTADDLASGRSLPGLGADGYVVFPRYPDQLRGVDARDQGIVLSRGPDGSWKFSAATVKGIDALYDLVRDAPVLAGLTDERQLSFALWLQSKLPEVLVANEFLGLEYWQWIGLLVLIVVGVLGDFALRVILGLVSRRVIAAKGGEARRETIRKAVRPFGLAAAALFWLWTVRLLDLPADALRVLLPAVRFFAMLAMVWAGFRVTDLVGEVLVGKAARTETKFDDLLIPLLRKTVKIFIFIFGLIYIADSLDIKIAPLLAGLGIGGIGFAFAARDTLENFFGSMTVLGDQPFQVGDWVAIGDVEGTVETLGFRSSRIRTGYNSLVTIPNGNLVRATVDNYGKRKYRRWKTHIGVMYDTPPDTIEALCEGIRELIRLHPYTRKDFYEVWLNRFGPSSLDIMVYVFHEVPDYSTELRERHRLMLDIIRLTDRLGVEFAFPTQTLHLYQENRESAKPKAPAPAQGHDSKAMGEGRRAVHELTASAAWRATRPSAYVFTEASLQDDDTQIESTRGGDS